MAGGSLKLFQFVQICYQIYGINPPNQPNPKQLSSNTIKAIFLTSYAQLIFTTVAFALIEAKSMFDYGFVFFVLISMIVAVAIYLIFIWQSENTLEFIKNFEGFINKRAQSAAAYNGLIDKIELFNQILCFGFFLTGSIVLVLVVPFTYGRYYLFNMGQDSFYLFIPAWYPFDWKTPIGYLVAWLAQCAVSIATCCIDGQFLNLVIGSCWLFIFIAEDITQDVVAFNIATKTDKSDKNRTELTKCFCGMVQIYSDAKQCVMEFNHVFEYSLFAFLSWEILGISSLLVTIQFELWADDSNLFEIVFLILVVIWMTLFTFLLCEPGERMTNQLVEFGDELNRCDWYLLSTELQRCYIIFLLDTQNPIKMSSYANIACERETSKKIINTVFSYFMTFRRFRP